MEKEFIAMLQVMFTKASFKMEKVMAKVFMFIRMEIFMKENTKMM